MEKVKKAELIEGVVYMPSPVRLKKHAEPHAEVVGWLLYYKAATRGVAVADNASVRLDFDNEPQPDLLMRVLPGAGGQSRDSEDDYVEGAPEFVAEIASSSASYDVHEKKRAYRRNGVCEYLVWLVDEERIEWWQLDEGEYISLPIDQGIIKSGRFPGLWLDAAALIRGDSAQVLARLQQGLQSPEHAEFVALLEGKLR
jgi:Uma2 family endonuclease